jgi:hypothetical protein
MPLFDDVRTLIQRLAPRGWSDLMNRHGLNLNSIDLATELRRPLVAANGKSTIDRTLSGFEDFCTLGAAAIEPGQPARSLLYHALASPNVYPMIAGPRTDADFPTLVEIDTLENYIYSLANKKLADFGNVSVAVFAYQYRPGGSSVHRRHADVAYSRTGVARVGTRPAHYDPLRRSFWPEPQGGSAGVAIMPARYAAFLVERRKPSAKDAITHPLDGQIAKDNLRTFLFPVHKLFPGKECLKGLDLQVSFHEHHRNEKLRKIHQLRPAQGGIPPLPGFNINQPPFVRESQDLVTLQPVGASTLVSPIPHAALAETVTQTNSVSGQQEIARFQVPAATGNNRFPEFSSFNIQATNAGRAAPEYVHIRLHVRPNGQLFDLNTLASADYQKVLTTGMFQGVPGVEDGPLTAAHFADHSCDGAVVAQVTPAMPGKSFAAVSLVAAPDFLPLVGQIDVQRWAEAKGLTGNIFFAQGGPEPLCYGRDVNPNPAITDPISGASPAFDRADAANNTTSALISAAPQGISNNLPTIPDVATTWLTDAAADVFEPGWDTSIFTDNVGEFYSNYGLGSPFPEDAKLCAALNSFWPAAAPDTGRTFGQMTALPLLDEELGFHPKHPKVLAGGASSRPGWDGEFGPYLSNDGANANFVNIERSDYTLAAFHGRMSLGLLGRIDAGEQLARMDAFRECADRIRKNTAMRNFRTLLVTAEKITDWAQRADRLAPKLTGPGYLYVFVDVTTPREDPSEAKRVVAKVKNTFVCQVAKTLVGLKKNNATATVTPWKHP